MVINMHELESRKKCLKKEELKKAGVKTTSKKVYINEAIKMALRDKKSDKKYFLDFFETIPNGIFTKIEIESISNSLSKSIASLFHLVPKLRYIGAEDEIEVDGQKIKVYVDCVGEILGEFAIINVKEKTDIKKSGKNSIEKNLEAYCLAEWGHQTYPNKEILIGIYDVNAEKLNIFPPSGYSVAPVLLREKINEIKSGQFEVKENCFLCPISYLCNSNTKISTNIKPKNSPVANPRLNLTKTQHDAIMFDEGIMRINAGAGSGKTLVVALRVVELLKRGTKPEDILLMTFTNKATDEMRERIKFWVKKEKIKVDVDKMDIKTFNSFCFDIVKSNYRDLGYTQEPKVSNGIDRLKIIEDALLPFAEKQALSLYYNQPLMKTRSVVGALILAADILDEIESSSLEIILSNEEKINNLINKVIKGTIAEKRNSVNFTEIKDFVIELYNEYNKQMKEKNLVSFNGQIQLALNCLERKQLYDYEHIIIDEFQDTSIAQIDVILSLISGNKFKSLMVVGDDAQAIYEFRYASKDNLIDFNLFFEEVKDIKLEQSFRSTKNIILWANELNNLNKKKIDKKLISSGEEGEMPQLISTTDSGRVISQKIMELIEKQNYSFQDIAIISRTKKELNEVKKELTQNNIPSIMDVPEPITSNPDFLFSLDLLDGVINNSNSAWAYYYLINKNPNFSALSNEAKNKELTELISDVEKLSDDEKKDFLINTINEICENEIAQIINDILNENESDLEKTLSCLKEMALYQDKTTFVRDANKCDAVILTTSHTSKGKEYKVVFVLLDGFNSENNLEEERRILYVSITRAKEQLFMVGDFSLTFVHPLKDELKKIAYQISKIKGV